MAAVERIVQGYIAITALLETLNKEPLEAEETAEDRAVRIAAAQAELQGWLAIAREAGILDKLPELPKPNP